MTWSWPLGPLLYRYDRGDGWEVEVRLDEILERPPTLVFRRCHAGKRAGRPEDCSGIDGGADLSGGPADPADPENENLRQWVGPEWEAEERGPRIITG